MIIDKEVEVKIAQNNVKYYRDRLNINLKLNQILLIEVSDLHVGSSIKINCECDVCHIKKIVSYKNYNTSFNRGGLYTCANCKTNKTKETNLKRYGVDNVSKLLEVKNKISETNLKKYGVKYYTQTEDYIKKTKKTNVEKYGYEWRMMSDSEKKKYISTCLERYGVDNAAKSDIVKSIIKKGFEDKYGVRNIMELEETILKIKDTCLEKYGVDSYTKTIEYLNKYKNTCSEKYGVDNLFKDIKVIDIIRKKHIESGRWSNDLNFKLYRRKVNYLTKKIKSKLYEDWNGYDYYDNEYLKDNLLLNSNNNKYPSIDHKISALYGYINNIDPSIISDIENLCITKRSINSKKHTMCEMEFKEKNITYE